MRKAASSLAVALLLVCAGTADASSGGIRGTVLDATCATGCEVPCPPPPSCRAGRICLNPGAAIVCPQSRIAAFPPYTGENATVVVRRRGSATVLARLTPHEGRFSLPLNPGRYIVHAYVNEECWSGERSPATITLGHFSTLTLVVRDNCIAHPDTESR